MNPEINKNIKKEEYEKVMIFYKCMDKICTKFKGKNCFSNLLSLFFIIVF